MIDFDYLNSFEHFNEFIEAIPDGLYCIYFQRIDEVYFVKYNKYYYYLDENRYKYVSDAGPGNYKCVDYYSKAIDFNNEIKDLLDE